MLYPATTVPPRLDGANQAKVILTLELVDLEGYMVKTFSGGVTVILEPLDSASTDWTGTVEIIKNARTTTNPLTKNFSFIKILMMIN
jgi:hypothetical protein